MRVVATLYVAIMVVFPGLCLAQQGASDNISLRNLPSEQLEKCLNKATLCGRNDMLEISDELERPPRFAVIATTPGVFWRLADLRNG